MKRTVSLIIALILLFTLCSCSGTLLDSNDPVTLTMWHVYGEQANSPMNILVDEFNSTVGREKGIIVNVTSMTNSSLIGEQLLASQSGVLGAEKMPDLFFCHNNNAEALGVENLIDWGTLFTEDELSGYVEEFTADGMVGDKLAVFPVSKSTHLLFVNGTQFDKFSAASGVTYESLSTWDGFFDAAAKFYDYSGGKPFCAFDYILRAVELYAQSLGETDYMGENGWYDPENRTFTDIWDRFAEAIASGHILVSDLYSNTQVMTGEVIVGCGSSASILYYNDTVTYPDNTSEEANLQVLPMPQANSENALVTQAGVGLCAYKTTEQKAEAAEVFARYLTESERNLDFAAKTGYMPVTKEAFESISEYPFEQEAYKNLYNALNEVQKNCTAVKEVVPEGYYAKVYKLYDACRAIQSTVNERRANGESVDTIKQEISAAAFENIG